MTTLEARAVRRDDALARKKKKKKKSSNHAISLGQASVAESTDKASQIKKKKKRRPTKTAEDDVEAKATAKASAYAASGHSHSDDDRGVELVDLATKERYKSDRSDDRAVAEMAKLAQGGAMNYAADDGRAAAELGMSTQGGMDYDAYCFEADTEVMAEINQDGLVRVDAAGGIQAEIVAETIALDGAEVGIIKSDAEVEAEEKRQYSKYFCLVVAALVAVIVALAVPLTLRYAQGRRETRYTRVTAAPTEVPSNLPSAAPSSMPSSIRFTEIVRALEPLSGNALWERGSPQYMAAMWMADNDPIQNLKRGGTGMDLDDARFVQRYVMVLFYFAMDGANWLESQGWLGEESECEWFGVKGSSDGCPGGCIPRSDFLGDYDKVCRISMSRGNNLYGQLPDELAELAEIRWFEIQEAFLVGTIPSSIGSAWSKLHTMLLGSNYLSGGFPDTFEDNHMLGTIFIDHNLFNGTFPNTIATLKNLEWLDAEGNAFWGTLPEGTANLKSLRILNVNNNSLTGYLPDTWNEDNLIEDLEVAYNNFKGRLPPSLAKAQFLKDFRASGNGLTGSLPLEYYKFEYLEELYLDQNMLGGELPQTAEPFYDGLQEFSIHSNNFEGNFPIQHFEDTLRVKVISLHRNDLTGSITTTICDRKDASRAYTQLEVLTADCDKIECSCCTCYIGGELVQGTDR